MKIDINKYSIDEYKLLRDLIEDEYKTIIQSHNKPFIIEFLEHIISGKINMDDPGWINLRDRSFLYKHPLKFMPLCLNHKHRAIRIIVRWRLKVGK